MTFKSFASGLVVLTVLCVPALGVNSVADGGFDTNFTLEDLSTDVGPYEIPQDQWFRTGNLWDWWVWDNDDPSGPGHCAALAGGVNHIIQTFQNTSAGPQDTVRFQTDFKATNIGGGIWGNVVVLRLYGSDTPFQAAEGSPIMGDAMVTPDGRETPPFTLIAYSKNDNYADAQWHTTQEYVWDVDIGGQTHSDYYLVRLRPSQHKMDREVTGTEPELVDSYSKFDNVIFEIVGAAIPGDTDGDGDVDLDDLFAVRNNFGTTSGATLADGDTDGNGDVDLDDLFTVRNNFGTGLAAVPEPMTLWFVGLGALALLRRRRRLLRRRRA